MQKGSRVPPEIKDKMIQTKKEKHLGVVLADSKIKGEPCTQVVPSHRKKQRFSSIEEYKEVLARTQWAVRDFARQGYAKNQVVFFNYLLKGKLSITKEQFVEEYQQNHLELSEIAQKYGLPEDYMPMIREHFNIKRIGATGLKRAKETKPLSNRQREIVYGSMMGDAMIDKAGALRIKHGGPQKEYVECLVKEFREHCKGEPIDYFQYFDERYGKSLESYTLRTQSHREFKEMRRMFYPEGGKKIVTVSILDHITELGLAIWYMDDGTVNFLFDDSGKAIGLEIRIFTCSFSEEECWMISEWLMSCWKLDSTVRFKCPKEKRNPFVSITRTSGFNFLDLIRPHIYDCMRYKVDPEEWLKWRAERGNLDVFGNHGAVGTLDRKGNFSKTAE